MLQRHQKASLAWFRPKHFLKSVTSFMALFIHSLIHLCIIIILIFFSGRVRETQRGSGGSTVRTRHKSKILYLSPFLKANWKNGSLGSVSLRVHFLCCAAGRSRRGGPGGPGAAAAPGLRSRVRPGSPGARACRAVGVERGAAGAGAQPARSPGSALASPAGSAEPSPSLPCRFLSCRRPPG